MSADSHQCEIRLPRLYLERYIGNEGPVLRAVTQRIQCNKMIRRGGSLIFTVIGERARRANNDRGESVELGRQLYAIVTNTLDGLGD